MPGTDTDYVRYKHAGGLCVDEMLEPRRVQYLKVSSQIMKTRCGMDSLHSQILACQKMISATRP